MGLNELINNRIGLGKFQIHSFIVLCLIDINDGVQLVLSSFLNPIIKAVFPQLTSSYVQILASVFYVGILIGSISSGILADKYGRKRLITYGSIVQIGVSLLFYCANNLEIMVFLRFLYGFSFGFTISVTTSMFAQISPAKYRGKGILLINFFISFGKLYGVMLGYAFINKLEISKTNWKLMMVYGTLPNIIVFIGSLYVLQQSPRYLLANQQIDKGLFVIEKMLEKNGKQALTFEQQKEIRQQFKQVKLDDEALNYHSFWVLWHKNYFKKVLALCICGIVINFCFYGQLVIEAFHIKSKTSGIDISKYLLTVFGQIPSLLISIFLIDHPKFGRKNSLVCFFLGASISHFLFSATQITLIGAIARFFMKDVFQILYPLITESFDTKMRTKGFGFCSGSGRIGSIIMPFVVIPMDEWMRGSVYIFFGILSIMAAVVAFTMVEQTMNKRLDEEGKKGQSIELQQILISKEGKS